MCLVVAGDGSSVVFSSVRRLIYVNSSACRFPSEQGCSLLFVVVVRCCCCCSSNHHTPMNDIHTMPAASVWIFWIVEGRSRVGTRADDDRYRGDRQTQKCRRNEFFFISPYRQKSTMVRSAVQYPLQQNAVLISVPY